MTRPLALDLFCCSGGITKGLEAAGFDVVGIDLCRSQLPKDHPLYSSDDGTQHWTGDGECHMADLSTADAVAAVIAAFNPAFVASSPPCQRFSVATPTKNRGDHPDLVGSTREGILRSGVPGWIENVATDAVPLTGHWVMLCGIMFDLWRLKRHRRFELLGWRIPQPYHDNRLCMYGPQDSAGSLFGGEDVETERRVAVAGHGAPDAAQSRKYKRLRDVTSIHDGSMGTNQRKARSVVTVSGDNGSNPGGVPGTSGQNRPGPECVRWREALRWIDGPQDRYSLAQCIPPAYAEFLGRRFLATRK